MAVNSDPDAALMLRVQRGDLVAFEALVEKYQQPILNLIARTLGDATEAEDLAQNVFVQVHRSAHRYRVSAKFSTWLYTIARNLCLNEIRRRARHPAESLDRSYAEQGDEPSQHISDARATGPDRLVLRAELERKVEEAIRDLPENQRMALVLCQQEELAYEDIAAVLGVSLAATKSLIHRARTTLKERLKPYLQSGVWRDAER